MGEGETEVDPLIDKSMAGQENAGDEWKFMSVEAYEVFQAKKLLKVQLEAADAIDAAVAKVLDQGYRTPDIYTEGTKKGGHRHHGTTGGRQPVSSFGRK